MALYIVYSGNSDNYEELWNSDRGSSRLATLFQRVEDACISTVQADGGELTTILKVCKNLPYTEESIQYWFGDMAKFVAIAYLSHLRKNPEG